MTVRRARPGDAIQLGPLLVLAWQQAYIDIIPETFLLGLDPAARTTRFVELIEDETTTVLVAEEGDQLAGFASCGPARDVDGWGELYAIYLRSQSWGRGLGHSLLVEAEATLATEFDEAMLWVLTDNRRARAFYERNGWRATEERQHLEIADLSVEELRYNRALTESPNPDPPDR